MGKTLILMRHGKAQSRDQDAPDDQRALTRAGKRALIARLPRSLRLWDRNGSAVIWTSDALRCRQTADVLATALERQNVSIASLENKPFLLEQDIDRLLAETACCNASCIVCVGHNPFIEETADLLSGARIHFKPGALAAFELADEYRARLAAPGKPMDTVDDASIGEGSACEDLAESVASEPVATLLWFVQGTPVDNWKTLCELEDIIKEAHERMTARLSSFLDDADDVETLHKLRVSIRTLRSLLRFLAPFHRTGKARAVQRDLRSIVIPTSRLRELDVLAEEARRMEPPSDDLVAACLKLRAAERDRVLAFLTGDDASWALERIARAVKKIDWKRRIEKDGLTREAVAERFAAMEAAVDRKLSITDLGDATSTHDLRKAAKRMRYAAENFAAFLDAEAAAETSERMKAVQDDLGALCDARVNVDIINEFPRKGLSDQILRDLAALEAQNRYFIAAKLRTCNHGRSSGREI